MTAPADSPHSERRDKLSRIKRVVLWVGLACLLQFLDLALTHRGLNCTMKAIQQYERIQSLEIDERFQKQARRFAEELR